MIPFNDSAHQHLSLKFRVIKFDVRPWRYCNFKNCQPIPTDMNQCLKILFSKKKCSSTSFHCNLVQLNLMSDFEDIAVSKKCQSYPNWHESIFDD